LSVLARALPARASVLFCALAFASTAAGSVLAGAGDAPAAGVERISTQADQRSLNVTIYTGGAPALIHDRRRIAFGKGEIRLAWRDVSGQLDPTSAIVRELAATRGLGVLEQNFDFDLLGPSALLARAVGSEVTVVHDLAHPGQPRRERARILAANDGIVLQYADRVETSLEGSHLEFDRLPSELRDRPTLVLDLESAIAGERDVDLVYLSGGLGWSANYVATVAADRAHLDLVGLVTLTNTSGATYRDAHVQLVAGNVNVATEPPVQPFGGPAMPAPTPPPTPAPVQQEGLFEYHLYTLTRPTTISNGQRKQVRLLGARRVPIRLTLELRGSDSYYANANADLGDKLPVGAYVTFTNKGGDLGIPLPAGLMRLYQNDSRGTSQFLGADSIEHTPKNEDVRLHLGDSFDVTAKKTQTDFKIVRGGCSFESAYAVRLANAKPVAADVLVVEPIPGDWTILAENRPHRKTSSSTASWTVRIPSDSYRTLTYRVRVKECGSN
jgi:hypothetical protein